MAVRIGRPDLAGEAALVAEPTFDEGIDRVIRALCERALAVLDGAPAELRARVLAHYAWVCDHLSDLDAANPAASEALVLAEASGDPTALEAALIAHHMVRSGPDGLAEREANADRLWALGTRTGRTAACLSASEWRFDAASERGDLARAARELEAIGRWATRVGGPMAQWRLLRCRAMLAQASGCYAEAYRLGAQAFGTLAATGFPPAFLLWGGLRSIQCHHTGQTSESLGTFGITDADAAGLDWPLAGVIPTLAPASMLADAGRLREAGAVYRRLGPASEWQESPHAACSSRGRAASRPPWRSARTTMSRPCARNSAPGAGTMSSTAAMRWRTAVRSSSISAGRPHTSGWSTMRSPTSSRR